MIPFAKLCDALAKLCDLLAKLSDRLAKLCGPLANYAIGWRFLECLTVTTKFVQELGKQTESSTRGTTDGLRFPVLS